MTFRLLLGAKAESLYDIRLPCFASVKVDGWRAWWQGLEFFTRNGKTLPNRALRAMAVLANTRPGLDGEIIVGDPCDPLCFNKTDRFCKTARAPIPPEGVRFLIFDNTMAPGDFYTRYGTLLDVPPFVEVLTQHVMRSYDELEAFEASAVAEGYEGICTRSFQGPYKAGRSTLREQYLVKLKRYIDEEVKIVRLEEKQHNANPAFIGETGYTKRSSHAEGKVPAGTLGAIIVEWHGQELGVGTGWDQRTARELWELRDTLPGKIGTIRFSPPTKDLPRSPAWKGLRSDL